MADRHFNISPKARPKGRGRLLLSLALLPIALSGCAGQPIPTGQTARTVTADQAMVMPPPAGPSIVSVIERRYDNAVEQEIHLATSAQTPGQNLIKAQFFGTARPFQMSSNGLSSTPLSEAGINREIRNALPTVRMARSQFYVQNNYGPFGYAFGRGPGTDLCMFAWQQVRSPTGTISPLANWGSIQIRVRVCEAGASEQRLLGLMYNFTITEAVDAPGWNPYGEPNPVSPTLGTAGAPIYPRAQANEPVAMPQPQATTRQPRPAAVRYRAPVRRAAPVAQPEPPPLLQPTPDMPRVPSPMSNSPISGQSSSRSGAVPGQGYGQPSSYRQPSYQPPMQQAGQQQIPQTAQQATRQPGQFYPPPPAARSATAAHTSVVRPASSGQTYATPSNVTLPTVPSPMAGASVSRAGTSSQACDSRSTGDPAMAADIQFIFGTRD